MTDNRAEVATDDGALMAPSLAASRLGVSGAALRRMSEPYVAVYGELPQGAGGRLWPSVAIERLRAAKALMGSGRARSVRGALELLQGGAQMPVEVPPVLERGVGTPGELVAEIRALRGELAELRRAVAELRALPPASGERAGERGPGGLLVRLAYRLERLIGRGRSG